MKTIIINKVMNRIRGIIIMLLFLSVFAKTQGQTAIVTYDPLKNGLGIYAQTMDYKFNPSASYEMGKYCEYELIKISLGISYLWLTEKEEDVSYYFNLNICYNKLYQETPDKIHIISPELGCIITIKRQTFLIMFDPLNWEGKIGIGYKF